MQVRSKRFLATATALATVMSTAACSSSSGSAGGSGGGGGSSAAAGGAPSGAVAAAQTYLAPFLKPPTTIGLADKLTKPPGAGKKVVFITCEVPTCTDFATGFKSAAAALSWSATTLVASAADPSANSKQILQAVAQKPDAIVITGGNVPTWKQALDAAKAAHIPVFGTSMEAYPLGDSTGLYSTIPVNSEDRIKVGTIMGNWIVADSDAKANVVSVTIPELKIPLSPFSETVNGVLTKACPDTCKSDILNIPFPDVLGGKAPGEIVSYLQSHPKVGYVSMAGGFETGVAAAIKQAGLKSVKVLDASANEEVEAGVKSGVYAAALGYAALMIGWYAANAVARNLAGLAPGDSATAALPTQLLTPATVGTPQNFQQPSDYQAQFKALWGLS